MAGFNLKYAFAFAACITAAACCKSTGTRTFEAEDAILTGTNVDTAVAGYTGS